MKTDGRFYLSYEREEGNEYTVSIDMRTTGFEIFTDEGMALQLAKAANALLRMIEVSPEIRLQVEFPVKVLSRDKIYN